MYELPSLAYDYEALSRAISGDIMKLHHDKHHKTYVDKLNLTIQSEPSLMGFTIDNLFSRLEGVPEATRKSICNNGGGHYNHSLFWLCMSPNGGGEPEGDLLNLIIAKYGSFQQFVDEFTTQALSVFGSGWVWLQPNADIITTPNQDNPIILGLDSPLLCLDVWEHAYYLDYKNKRDDYIKAWWGIVDWNAASIRYSDYLEQ